MTSTALPIKRLAHRVGLLFLALSLSACATYQSKVSPARELLADGRAEEAAEKLKPLAATADGDQLAYLLDYATVLRAAGRYQDSVKAFLAADRLAEELDYHSASRVAGSLLLNEEMKQYKGDTFEKIFINAQLALNFLAMDRLDDALVESRRINEKYVKLRSEDKKSFELNPFAKYLSAVIWEADRKYDDAAIAYAEAYKLSPEISGIKEDLIRSTKLARRDDEYQRRKKEFPGIVEKPEWYDRKHGELVVIVEQGWGPRKDFSRVDITWPELRRVSSQTRAAVAEIDGGRYRSRPVYDVEAAAIRTLEEDRLSLLGRRVGGMVAKDLAAQELRKKNELLGAVALIAMHASDRADLRQWSTLPESVQFIRVFLKPGQYRLTLQGVDAGGVPTADHEMRSIDIKANRKTFVSWRTLR